MALASGWTKDGWRFRIFWSDVDGKFRVEFTDGRKEIWILDELAVEKVEGLYVCKLRGAAIYTSASLKEVLVELAYRISFILQNFGSREIRGGGKADKVETRWGAAKRIVGLATPVVPVALAEELRKEREEAFRVAPAVPTTVPSVMPARAMPERLGLGSAELRRLRVLFETALLETMGVKPTRDMLVKAEGVIYRLDMKYKATLRDEALEKATVDLLRWIRDEFYFAA